MSTARAGTAKSKRLPRQVRERQMLDAAVETFARRGYRVACMDDIAELAGVSKPLVYQYLNSKEELFSACIRREADALLAEVRAAVEPGAPPDRQLWRGLMAFFGYVAEHPHGWVVLYEQARAQGEPFCSEFARIRSEFVGFVAELIGQAARNAGFVTESSKWEQTPVDPVAEELVEREVLGLAQALVGAAESLAGWASGEPGQGAKETAATLMNFAWTGLDNLLSGRRWASALQPVR